MKTKVEINQQLIDNQREALRACMTVDSEMGKRLREAIFQELKAARNKIVEQIRFDNGDPRGTAHAVKRYIASKYLGGVVSILDGKTSGNKNSYEAPRLVPFCSRFGNVACAAVELQRGGSRPDDRILVLDKGRIMEDGTYHELIAKNGYFAELVARQRLDV